MHSLRILATALSISTAAGYTDTSPFFLFSTSDSIKLSQPPSSIQSADSINKDIIAALSFCPTERYLLIHQHNVTASDYDSRTTPHLASYLSSSNQLYSSKISVSDVIFPYSEDPISWEQHFWWQSLLQDKCNVGDSIAFGANNIPPSVKDYKLLLLSYPLSGLPTHDLTANDQFLSNVIDNLNDNSITVLYSTSPRRVSGRADLGASADSEGLQYEMESEIIDSWHMELKRDLEMHLQGRGDSNRTVVDGGLFERYQFFSPGIFMGLIATFILLLILYFAISALASLQVTYAAFDKENGQLANKKAQ